MIALVRVCACVRLCACVLVLRTVVEDWDASALILGLDSNADCTEPEMVWLCREDGGRLCDSFHLCFPSLAAAKHGGNTWDNKNPLTQGNLIEPDQRVGCLVLWPRTSYLP